MRKEHYSNGPSVFRRYKHFIIGFLVPAIPALTSSILVFVNGGGEEVYLLNLGLIGFAAVWVAFTLAVAMVLALMHKYQIASGMAVSCLFSFVVVVMSCFILPGY